MSVETKFPPWVDAISGGFGACFAKTLLAPAQRVVVIHQLGDNKHLSNMQVCQKIMKEGDGIRAFWRGNLTSIIQRFPYSGSQLLVYGQVKHFVQHACGLDNDGGGLDSFAKKFVIKAGAGGIAATISGTFVYPFEVIRTRIMSGDPRFRAIIPTAKAIWTETNGPRHFFKGLNTSLIQRIPDILINFAVYESVKYNMEFAGVPAPLCVVAGGSAAAITAVAFTFPLDTCKRRIALAGTGGQRAYHGLLDCAGAVVRNDGFAALYRGARLECCRCAPQVVIMWFSVEWCRKFLMLRA